MSSGEQNIGWQTMNVVFKVQKTCYNTSKYFKVIMQHLCSLIFHDKTCQKHVFGSSTRRYLNLCA
jgi:hypothetical protein